ncbi:MAG: prepilin-type N-terminal cleavage/methylation domain-containing protein [Alphaproteobacteria bacterium]|nr:prepilin-type N-terminal cleavage/methylation domain-containing protein [Alphaproteobacteria bacterium]
MKKIHRQKGFTLVELAIVLTIIGLLIGGILKGQQLMQNARVTATIAQIQAIESATTTFRDTYNAVPGDIFAPNTRLAGFQNTTIMPSLGDGIVGPNNWTMLATQGTSPANPAVVQTDETTLFWGELSAAGLLSGIAYTGTAAPTLAFGATHPVARVGGGWVVGNADGNTGQALSAAVAQGPSRTYITGMVLALIPSPTAAITTTAGTNILTPTLAAQMDRKMDDGNALSGFVQGGGLNTDATAGCLNGAAAPHSYNENLTSKDCAMFFRIQG